MLYRIVALSSLCALALCSTYHFTANFLDEFQNGISCKRLSIYAIHGDIEEQLRTKIYQSYEEIGGVYQFIWNNPSITGRVHVEIECQYEWIMEQRDLDKTRKQWQSLNVTQKREIIECSLGSDARQLKNFLNEQGPTELEILDGKSTDELIETFDTYLGRASLSLNQKNRKVILKTKAFDIEPAKEKGARQMVKFLDITTKQQALDMRDQCLDYVLEPGTKIRYGADGIPYPAEYFERTGWPSLRDRNYFVKIFSKEDEYMERKCHYKQGKHSQKKFQKKGDGYEIKIKTIEEKLNPPEVEMAAILKFLSKIDLDESDYSEELDGATCNKLARSLMGVLLLAFLISAASILGSGVLLPQ